MARLIPLAAKESTAAQLLDMSVREFRAGVAAGHLPAGKDIGGEVRWDTGLLQRIITGELIDGNEEVRW
ncbi:hypothetical protein [Phaeobacter inhibens]|uniref:hypothetical protein n=1 Tax=Phaeobacter inhibens TaxID=221822 RepID=UPI0021A4C2C3|nr:hypothetical protein [Phaeobacter inhibens]UWR59443.1 hypothetical protein K4F88_10895 [Phaeobacter inhibens]